MSGALYTPEILRLTLDAARFPRLSAPDASAEGRAPLCGSRMTVDLALDADGRVAVVGMAINACAFGQAAAALLAQGARGRSAADLAAAATAVQAWLEGAAADRATGDEAALAPNWPGIAALAPARDKTARHGAMLLPFRLAAQAALQVKIGALR